MDFPSEPRPEHHVGALVDLGHEALELAEVVGPVSVADDDDVPSRGRQTREVRAPVPAPLLVDNGGTFALCDLNRAVRRAVVDHDHLARAA